MLKAEKDFKYPPIPPRLALHDMLHGNNTSGNPCFACTHVSPGEAMLYDMIPDTDENQQEKERKRANNKRVTIHFLDEHGTALPPLGGRLIILPDSIEELLKIAGKKFGMPKANRIKSAEDAEIDDLCVIRDEDHLFFLCYDKEV